METNIHIDDSNDSPLTNKDTPSNNSVDLGAFSKWYLNKHFEVLSTKIDENSFTVKCLLCTPKHKMLQGSTYSTSNLHTHLKIKHSEILNESLKSK